MLIPASCGYCGLLFGSHNLIHAEGEATVRITNGTTNCPRCGQRAQLLDGVYQSVGDSVRMLATSEHSVRTLTKLADTIRAAQLKKATAEEIQQSITTEIPELSSFASFLPKKRSELYLFLGMILAAITLILN